MLDLRGFRVMYNNIIYNAIRAENIDFVDNYSFDRHFQKPDEMSVWVIDEDNQLVLLHDKADKFQFIRIVN